MRKHHGRSLSLCASFLLILLLFAGAQECRAGEATDGPGAFSGLGDIWERKTKAETETGKTYNTTPQLSEDDIFAMNGGDAAILHSEEGYVEFIRGRYYEGKVTDFEEGIDSLQGIASLIGLSKGCEFYGVYAEQNSLGYTFFTYQQRYGEFTLQNAVLKIVVDPEGYTAGLVSSFTPNVGIAPKDESAVTPEEAEEIVRKHFDGRALKFYPDYTRQTSVTISGIAYHAWAVFTDYPPGETPAEGRNYLQHLVAYDGSYLMYMAVASPGELVLGDNAQTELSLSWFEGMEEASWTGEVTLHDGSRKTLMLPVVRDPESGTYYLADLERHILLADCASYLTHHTILPYESEENSGWPEHYLLTYDSYIKVWDFFASYGLKSVDGFGIPMLILTDYCDESGNPVDNASFMGFDGGWALFAASTLNDFGEAVDVSAHEFTHGITTYTMAGDVYKNESGALNESLSDILGNLCEMMLGETEDTSWLLGEMSGRTVRSMSFPWLYRQPVTLGGTFYQETARQPDLSNDMGGVHTNSSLANHLAWQLCASGMSYQDAFLLWKETINLLTPYSGYKELHQALLFAAQIRGMDVEWLGMINMVCEQLGF